VKQNNNRLLFGAEIKSFENGKTNKKRSENFLKTLKRVFVKRSERFERSEQLCMPSRRMSYLWALSSDIKYDR